MKSPGPGAFTGEFYQVFTEEFASVLCSLVYKTAKEGILLKLFYESNITLTPKPSSPKKENYRAISLTSIGAKILSKI